MGAGVAGQDGAAAALLGLTEDRNGIVPSDFQATAERRREAWAGNRPDGALSGPRAPIGETDQWIRLIPGLLF